MIHLRVGWVRAFAHPGCILTSWTESAVGARVSLCGDRYGTHVASCDAHDVDGGGWLRARSACASDRGAASQSGVDPPDDFVNPILQD